MKYQLFSAEKKYLLWRYEYFFYHENKGERFNANWHSYKLDEDITADLHLCFPVTEKVHQ